MLWFTSDLHLNHDNMLRYAHRPFGSVEELRIALVRNVNERVGCDDTLWILGDVCMGREKPRDIASFLDQLVCRDVRLARGNHDPKDDESLLTAGFTEVCDLADVSLGSKQRAVLCHYPMLSWNRRTRGSFMLHGHIHTEGMAYNEGNRRNGCLRYDVGVDANGFSPVSGEELKRFFAGVRPAEDAFAM